MAWLEIDLDHLAGNLGAVRASLPAGVRLEPVVKADAYGHGAFPVASWLELSGADGLCVATLDEGLALRAASIALPILVLYPIPPDAALTAADAGLAITVGDRTLLERTLVVLGAGAASRAPTGVPTPGATGVARSLAVHVEVETGLGRGGVSLAELPSALAALEADPNAELAGIWSHLASPADPERSGRQATVFADAIEALGSEGALGGTDGRVRIRPARHLSATGGLLAATTPDHDSVRLGLGLYGLLPDGLVPGPARAVTAAALRPVLSLHARPVRVADLPAGHGVSYGPSFETARPSRIATLPLGYGDGLPRSITNQAEALVRGRRVPLVGTVAMDAVMADVTGVPGDPVTVDDEFVLIGVQEGSLGRDEITVQELAQRRTTIAWEVVTQMARRLTRVYHAAAVPVGVRTLTEEKYLWSPR